MREQQTNPKNIFKANQLRLLALACLLAVSAAWAQTSKAASSTANFSAADTSTQGNWHGVYGGDGYSVANDSQSIPSYATFAVQNQENWTWAPALSTVDPRALQMGNDAGRIAATWYSSAPYYFDINLTDGNTHQIALYAVDWDLKGRSETIQIVDATTNTQLDVRSISGFTNGIYMIWNVSGHVHINITCGSGPNAVISGVFFGSASGVAVQPSTTSLTSGQKQQFSASVLNSTNQSVSWTINPEVGVISSSGLYTAPTTISTAETVTVTATSIGNGKSSSSTVSLVGGAAVANFISFDTTTQGNWHGAYGADGYSVANDSQTTLSYGTYTVQNQINWTWAPASTTVDPRALQTGSNTGRIAAAWYESGTFNFDIDLTDGNPHRVAFYAVDWDYRGRTETIEIQDATSGANLGTQTVANFTNGVYAIWNITGHVKVTVTNTGSPNAVISGVLFGGTSSAAASSSASTSSAASASSSTPNTGSGTTTSSNSGKSSSGTTSTTTTASSSSTSSSTASSSTTSSSPAPAPQGQLAANATTVSFGNVNVGSSLSKTVSVSNTGNANVTISNDSISGAGLNAGGASGIVLTPGQSTTLNVTFTPAAAGAVTGTFTIASNASNSSLSVALSGTGVQPAPTTYSVALTWDTSSSAGVISYYVYRGVTSGGPYTQITSTALTSTNYTDTTAQAGQTYYYAVTSVNSSNVQSTYSNVADVIVP